MRLLDSFWKNVWLELRTSLKSVLVLRSALGWVEAISVGMALQKRIKAGEPFKNLPAPVSEKDEKSRMQIGPAIVLYEVLLERHTKEEALALVRDVSKEGAIIFLGTILPKIDRAWYDSLNEETKEVSLLELVERFPNSSIGALSFEADAFSFEVKRCAFVELANSTSHPELARVFCEGDGVYFERHVPNVSFERPTALASGGSCCDFRFKWLDGEDAT